MVDKHNELRDLIASGGQPGQPASDPEPHMEWDPALANTAQG